MNANDSATISIVGKQPSIGFIKLWNGRVAVSCEGSLHWLDWKSGKNIAVNIPASEVIDIGNYGEHSMPIALCKLPTKELVLLEERQGSWQKFPLPPTIQKSMVARMCTDKQTGAICVHNWNDFFWLNNGKWIQVEQHKPDNVEKAMQNLRWPTKTLLSFPNFYKGMDGGELGSGFFSLNLQTGLWSVVEGCKVPVVNDIKADSKKDIWVAQGSADSFTAGGAIRKVSGTKCDTIASVEGGTVKGAEGAIKRINWDRKPVSMLAIDFDKSGNVFVLTDSLGILRKDSARWIVLTENLPKDVCFTGFVIVDEKHALVATASNGVLDWNLASGRIRQIVLKKNKI